MSFDAATDVVVLEGDSYVSIIAITSLLGQAKAAFVAKGEELGEVEFGKGAGFVCDELRLQLMKLLA